MTYLSNAFEVTLEDVVNAVSIHGGFEPGDEQAEEIYDSLDVDEIISGALHYDSMEEQCKSVYEDIWKQAKEQDLV